MEINYTPDGPARLYALLLRLRPLQQGTLMPFSGELVEGAFLKWLDATAPEVASWLHEGNKRRFFTCSSLHFSQTLQPQLRAERENIHLPLDPQKTYTVRLTLLLGALFPLLYSALMRFDLSQAGSTKRQTKGSEIPPFIQIGRQRFLLEEVLISNDDPLGWTGFTSLNALVEKAEHMGFGTTASFTLEFASLTSFNRGNRKTGYGIHQVMLPLPLFVFQSLMKRWQDVAPPELAGVIQPEALERYLQEDGAIITDYNLTAHHVRFSTHRQCGFVGTCTYQMRSPNEKTSPQAPLTLGQQLFVLAQLAFHSGVGYKTAMGCGQTRLKPAEPYH